MSKHSHRSAHTISWFPLVAMLLGMVAGAVAWWYLVDAAIDFVSVARDGQGQAWFFMTAAGLGAVVCLVLVLTLGARILYALGLISDYKPRRAAARRAR